MIKGLIGEKLSHSYSKIIHEQIVDELYNLYSFNNEELDDFLIAKQFDFVNITIPYKEKVIPYVNVVSKEAKKIGAINLIINKNNLLYGYNTDYFGFKYMLESNNVNVKDKKCLILGTGGTSKTVNAVLKDLGAAKISKASRKSLNNVLMYEEIYDYSWDIIINTTPVGMYPNINNCLIDLSKFTDLTFVGDVIYNPLRTRMLIDAEKLNIKHDNGLKMLIVQAIKAHEIVTNEIIKDEVIEQIYDKICNEKKNIVLIGMPGSGKSIIGKEISNRLNKKIIDLDEYIEEKAGMKIPEIFFRYSEEYFRKLEVEACKEVSLMNNIIISTGGGIIKNKENIEYLKANGIIYFIDRSIDDIRHMIEENSHLNNRPLMKSRDDLERLYNERYHLYCANCDFIIKNDDSIEKCVDELINKI